jgi:hypothetical protein
VGRVDLAWQLFKESFAVLAADTEMLLFPVLSGVSALLLGASFFIPLYQDGVFEAIRLHKAAWDSYAVLFVWYYINFLVGIFFNSALMGCANIRLSGGKPSVSAGLRIAYSRIGPIAAWAFVAATVGLVLHSVRDRRNWLLSLVAAGLSLAWTLLTYLIVPVLLFEDRGIFDAIHRSQELFRSHWGEQVAGNFGFGLLSLLLSLPALALAAACWRWDPIAGIILAAVYLLILATVTSAVKGIFTVALYRYATAGAAPPGFSAGVIDGALGGRRRNSEQAPWDRAPWDRY